MDVIFTGEQALKLGLIDTLGSFEDAVKIAAKLSGMKGKPFVVEAEEAENTCRYNLRRFFSNIHLFEKDFIEQPMLQYKLN